MKRMTSISKKEVEKIESLIIKFKATYPEYYKLDIEKAISQLKRDAYQKELREKDK